VLGWQPAHDRRSPAAARRRSSSPSAAAIAAPGALPIAVLVPGFDARKGLTATPAWRPPDGVPQLAIAARSDVPVDFRRAALVDRARC
jgi:hypothetical protein